jgi:hypothetical protein
MFCSKPQISSNSVQSLTADPIMKQRIELEKIVIMQEQLCKERKIIGYRDEVSFAARSEVQKRMMMRKTTKKTLVVKRMYQVRRKNEMKRNQQRRKRENVKKKK